MNIQNEFARTDGVRALRDSIQLPTSRSQGVLSQGEIDWCKVRGIELAYDPVQIGWVPLLCEDDISETSSRPQSRQIQLRPWQAQDAADYAAMLSSERLWHYLPDRYPGPISEDDARQLIELTGEDHHEVLAASIDDTVIGQARMLRVGQDSAEISYWIGEQHWGKGYASSVVAQFCTQCLRQNPEIIRLFAVVHESNIASQSILKKCRFTEASRDTVWITFERFRRAS
ncbi:GNAT family N-acetyltransferase [Ruegeria sp. R13_0]|uniref:GNAT family N-acetyltransferase n=1 Tax=Ruegeria sp. R13_0 TaxID=2821099 RepID=UPI001ADC5177|nr:GNAT family N-acetyltransferase [Ruegeria sp. R13_0]MBO9436117.1 GNAT family N-acetyltransferase [Ruegeria sp. R13_0]